MFRQEIPTKIFYALSILFFLKLLSDVSSEVFDGTMQFTFGDKDQLGPSNWKSKKGRAAKAEGLLFGRGLKKQKLASKQDINAYERNRCKSNWLSPININTMNVNAPDLDKAAENKNEAGARSLFVGGENIPETLIISVSKKNIENELWEFGHPADDIYHGIEIRPPSYGLLNAMDYFDPLDNSNPFAVFDFTFLTLFYCDLNGNVHPRRSMHQLDGKRFPLELHFVFTRRLRRYNDIDDGNEEETGSELGEDLNLDLIGGDSTAIIVVVQGEVGSKQNKYFQPVVEAARKFRGKDFGVDEVDDTAVVAISSPWSVTWLLPDNSDYYYYDDGSFPVPPCWKVARYYIFSERIQISQVQLDALTNIQTEREPESGYTLPCTFSLLQQELLSGDVTRNLMDFELRGDDKKPRTPEEARLWRIRKQRMQDFRKRLEGKVILLDKSSSSNDGDGRAMYHKVWFNIRLVLILIILLKTQ